MFFTFFIFNKNAFLTFLNLFLQRFLLTTVKCQLANYALETLGERQFCCWNGAIEQRSCLLQYIQY